MSGRGGREARIRDRFIVSWTPFVCFRPTVARLLHPRASKLLDHPWERRVGAHKSRGAEIHSLPREITAGPTTTWPLTPPATFSTQRETGSSDLQTSPCWGSTQTDRPHWSFSFLRIDTRSLKRPQAGSLRSACGRVVFLLPRTQTGKTWTAV